VGHQHHRTELQVPDDRVEVADLVNGRVRVAGRLVGPSPAQEVERHHPSTFSEERDNAVVQVEVVGEAVHQNDSRLGPRVVPHVEAVALQTNGGLVVIQRGPSFRRLATTLGTVGMAGVTRRWTIGVESLGASVTHARRNRSRSSTRPHREARAEREAGRPRTLEDPRRRAD
jgi:hypothetical protein